MGIRACVHSFTLCEERPCPYGYEGHHLNIREAFVTVERGNAVALSYVWGQFGRKHRPLGHSTDGDQVTMELGEDWQLDDLRQALHRACNQSTYAYDCPYLWIDQLSIKQKDESDVRKTLVQIPQIFSNFNVLVLLQGDSGLCECWASLRSAFDLNKMSTFKDFLNRAIVHNEPSANLGMDLSKGEDKQLYQAELLGSTKIISRWISAPSTCPTLKYEECAEESPEQWDYDEMIQNLTLPSRLSFQDWVQKISSTPGGSVLSTQQLRAQVYKTISMIHWDRIEQAAKDLMLGRGLLLLHEYVKWAQTMKFLHGLPLEDEEGQRIRKTIMSPNFRAGVYNWKQWLNPSDSFRAEVSNLWQFSKESYKLSPRTTSVATEDFVAFLHALRVGRLSATKSADYVRAVWASCPNYEFPADITEKQLGPLLQNAIGQFQAPGRLLITTAPAGIFGQKNASAAWSPQLYLEDDDDVTAANDVYGPLFERSPDETLWISRRVAHLQAAYLEIHGKLRVTVKRDMRGLRQIVPCKAVPAHMTSRSFVEWLKSVVNQKEDMPKEHSDCLKRIEGYLLQHQWSESSETDFCKFLSYFTFAHNFSGGFTSEDLRSAPAASTVDGANGGEAAHIVLTPSGIQWEDLISGLVCVSLGLPRALAARHKLQVYSETQETGVSRLGLFNSDFSPDSNPCTVQVLPEKTLFYEAVRDDNGDSSTVNRYRIVGVWVPWSGHDQFGDAPVIIDPKGLDGIIV
ncbi:MAG: hypothetical protein Q9162_000813 [Coniocarpon cinnabarinum]